MNVMPLRWPLVLVAVIEDQVRIAHLVGEADHLDHDLAQFLV